MAASAAAPGAEFLQRRLARAEAVPADQRSPEVAAFIDSVRLMRQVAALLPLTSDGRPALPDSPEAQRREALAALLYAKAEYITPHDIQWEGRNPLAVYLQRALSSHRFLGGNALGPLAGVLHTYMFGLVMEEPVDAIKVWHGIVAGFARHGTLLRRQLADIAAAAAAAGSSSSSGSSSSGSTVAAADLPTSDQLQYVVHCHVAGLGGPVLSGYHSARQPPRPHAPADQLQEAREIVEESIDALQQLEPDSPKACLACGQTLVVMQVLPPAGAAAALRQRGLSIMCRGLRAARQSRSVYYSILLGARIGMLAQAEDAILPADMAALAAVTVEAETDAAREAKLLPELWGVTMKNAAAMLAQQAGVSGLRTALAAAAAGGSPAQAAAAAQAAASDSAARRARVMAGGHDADLLVCSNCGVQALGLRACSRCRNVKYCSKECQKSHWKTHKPDCLPS